MACGLPYANAAALAYPDRPVVAPRGAMAGLSMLMAELATAAKYDLNVKIVVLKNNRPWPDQMGADGISSANPEFGLRALQPN